MAAFQTQEFARYLALNGYPEDQANEVAQCAVAFVDTTPVTPADIERALKKHEQSTRTAFDDLMNSLIIWAVLIFVGGCVVVVFAQFAARLIHGVEPVTLPAAFDRLFR